MKTTLLFLSIFLCISLFSQNVYIPDANFKAYLVNNSQINTNGDTEIQVSEASDFNGIIDCSNQNISDLTGIEAFTALTILYCSQNQLTSLDVSQNIALSELYCESNQLTSLDVSQNTALFGLECGYNEITSLDLSNNVNLSDLFLWSVPLTSLDLSQNSNLSMFEIDNSELGCLNLKNGNNMNMFEMNLFSCPNLTCIEVDDAEWSTENWTIIEPQMYFNEDCNYPESCDASVGITELTTSKNLIQILDMMGRETTFKPNTPLIYVYDDGSTEKVFTIE